MRRMLIQTRTFLRDVRHTIKKNPRLRENIELTAELLSEDSFNPKLKTHKLKGSLEGSWACSAGYDLRIIFSFIQHEGSEAILLESVGTLDEVY